MKKFKTISIVVLLATLLILTIVMSAQSCNQQRQITELTNQIGIQGKQLTKSVSRAETKIVESSRELENFAEKNNLDIEKIKDDISRIGAQLKAVSSTTAETKTIIRVERPSDSTTPSKNEPVTCPESDELVDQHEYTLNTQAIQLKDENEMPVADVLFDASSELPWAYTIYGIRYIVNSSISRDRNDNLVLHSELLAENQEILPGKYFRIETVESNLLQIENKPEFMWWDPAIYLAISSGVNFWPRVQFSAAMNLNFSIMSYGNWRFIGLGVGFDGANNTFQASLTPFLYNIADHIPVVSNIYLYPYISINHESTVGAGIGIGVRL